MFSHMTDPLLLPAPLQALLDLFATDLAEVHFADIDASTLARLTREVQTANDTMLAAQAVLDGARTALQERRDTLVQHAHRALAYAKVYAESDEALSARLEAITLPGSGAGSKARLARRTRVEATEELVLSADPQHGKRARKTKSETTEPLLADSAAAE